MLWSSSSVQLEVDCVETMILTRFNVTRWFYLIIFVPFLQDYTDYVCFWNITSRKGSLFLGIYRGRLYWNSVVVGQGMSP